MKPFYLTKNAQGYYRAVFFNQQTGVCVKTKSTHSKDKMEAMLLSAEWYKNGTPDGYTNSRKKADDDVSVSALNLDGIVKRRSQAEADFLDSTLPADLKEAIINLFVFKKKDFLKNKIQKKILHLKYQ